MMDIKTIQEETASSSDQKFSVGSLIWGKFGSYKWWPAVIIKSSACGLPGAKFGNKWLFWLGDHKVSQVSRKKIIEFASNFNNFFTNVTGKTHKAAVYEALEILAIRCKYHHNCIEDLLSWAKNGFSTCDRTLFSSNDMPALVLKHLERIREFNNEMESTCNEDVSLAHTTEKMFISNAQFKGVKEGVLNIEDVCIGCFGNQVDIVAYHPLFEGGLCFQCKERLQENIFVYGNDGKNICCIICAQPGSLILCDNVNCHRSYCFHCIALLVSPDAQQQILQTTPWFCFFCLHYSSGESDLLRIKINWEERLFKLFQPTHAFAQEISMLDYTTKMPIKVLSLFDGISTGKLVLDKLGIAIEKYYACEIDVDALNVSKFHHSDSVIYMGDVTLLTEEKIQSICPIDLVIGGSPCNDLSLVNPARKGIYDYTGTGPLFFDFFHTLKTVQRLNRDKHVFFLYENVAAMSSRDKAVITSFLMQEPVLIDAKFVSPQSRPRYFWGNIPGMNLSQKYCYSSLSDSLSHIEDQSDELSCYLLKGLGRKAMVEKIRTVTTNRSSLIQDNCNMMPVEMNGEPDILWVTELEKIFGFPLHYTDTGNLSITKRRELIGRSWSVPVIKNILRPLLNFFKDRDELVH